MNRRKYEYNGEKYYFSTEKYNEYYEMFRSKKPNFKKVKLDEIIAKKCSVTEEAVKKWRNSGKSGSTPSSIETVETLSRFFGIPVLELMEPIEEGEEKMKYSSNDEKEAVKRVLRSFVDLLKTFMREKGKLQYEKLRIAEDNYYESMLPDGIVEECEIRYDGECYIYSAIDEKRDNVNTEILIAAIDLPEEIIKELKYLLMSIVFGDESESKFYSQAEADENEIPMDMVNYAILESSVMDYYDKLMDIFKPYNLGLEKYKRFIY